MQQKPTAPTIVGGLRKCIVGVVSRGTPIWPSCGGMGTSLWQGPLLDHVPSRCPSLVTHHGLLLAFKEIRHPGHAGPWRGMCVCPWPLPWTGPPMRDTQDCSLAAGFPLDWSCRIVCKFPEAPHDMDQLLRVVSMKGTGTQTQLSLRKSSPPASPLFALPLPRVGLEEESQRGVGSPVLPVLNTWGIISCWNLGELYLLLNPSGAHAQN